jgi:serine/threonine protein kinase
MTSQKMRCPRPASPKAPLAPRSTWPPSRSASAPKAPSVDLYAVGVLLYRLLTGALPFTSRMSWEVLLMHRDTPPGAADHPRAPDAQIPPALEAVVLRLMAKDPDARYASATELRLVLQDLLTQEGTHEQERQRAHRPIDAPAARRGLFAPERLGRWATRFMVGTTAATTFMVANLFSLRAADPPLLPAPEFEQEQEQEITVDAPAPPSEPTPGPIHAAPGDTAPASTDLPDDPDNDPDDGDFQIPTDPSTPRTRPRPIDQDPGGLLPIGSTGKGKKDPYQKALAKARASVITACKRSVATTITAEIEIDPATGRVTADLLGDRSSAAACVKKHLDALTFPRSKDGDLAPIHRRETFPL